MGAMCVHALSATTRAQYERQVLLDALAHLRATKDTLEQRCERIEADVDLYKDAMLDIGNRRKRRCLGAKQLPFTKVERLKFQFNATKRDMSVRELETIHNLLLTVERQISVMANADLYREGMYALRAGVTVGAKYQQAMDGYSKLLEDLSEQQDTIASVQQEIELHSGAGINDDAILEELEQLSEAYTLTGDRQHSSREISTAIPDDPTDCLNEQEIMSI